MNLTPACRIRRCWWPVCWPSRQGLEQLLASEREAFALLRDSSVARQTMLQARLGALKKQQGGETGDIFEREAKLRTDRANSARTQEGA